MNLPAKRPAKKEKIHLRVTRGALVPADSFAERLLREKKYKINDVVGAVITRLRNPRFNRLVHKIGVLCAENIDDFNGMDAHAVIKRLQLEGNIYCDEIGIKTPVFSNESVSETTKVFLVKASELLGFKFTDDGLLIVRTPRSLSFESLDEAEFSDAAKQICRLISANYWPSLDPEKIEEMAQVMIDE